MSISTPYRVNPIAKYWAIVVSWIFHPLLIPLYASYFLLFIHPSYFSGFSEQSKKQVLLIAALNGVMFPIISTLLLKALGFIDSFFMKSRRDRIIPYIICNIFFFWTYTVFHKQEMYPSILSSFWLGIFLACSAALMANIYFKISMHTIGVGGITGLFLFIALQHSMLMTWPFAFVILVSGAVATARLMISDHSEKEIYSGFLVGLLSQLIAAYIIV